MMEALLETSDQAQLRDTVQRHLRRNYDFRTRRSIAEGAEGWSRAQWNGLAELGLLAAPLGSEHGGLGDGLAEGMIVMEELGRHLVVEPYFETAVLAANIITGLASPEQQAALLPDLLAGATIWAVALAEADGHDVVADRGAGAARLNGEARVVTAAAYADYLLVEAQLVDDPARTGVFVVASGAQGLSLSAYETIDGRRAADVTFQNVELGPSAQLVAGPPGSLDIARERALAAQCAEAVGIIAVLNEMTLEYARTRKQFGQPIGRFQVVQHRLVDMYIAHREAAAITRSLAWTLRDPGNEASHGASAAKVKVAEAARLVGQQAIQLHGGMGMTDELAVGHYAKRLMVIAQQLGSPDQHLDRLAEAIVR
jgi:alkylation response protein AidB-like acyl-CoA dehydrogenase